MSDTIETPNDFRELCNRIAAAEQQAYTPMDVYFNDPDFDNYQRAAEWWPKDVVPALALPDLNWFARARQIFGVEHSTFDSILANLTARCVQWLESEGRDVQYPNETPAQRKARKATARHRSKGQSTDPAVAAAQANAKQLYQNYQDLCAARKLAFTQAGVAINAAYAAYEDAKEALESLSRGQP